MTIANNDDQMAIDEIFSTTAQCQLPVDASKRYAWASLLESIMLKYQLLLKKCDNILLQLRANIIANFKTLSHTFRGRRAVVTSKPSTPPASVASVVDFSKDSKICYDEAEMNKKFEDFVYHAVRHTEFGNLKNDATVRKQCELISM